ncbi:MAG: HEAT repeat domain-containing protein [Acidobacteriota bacterium]
MSHDSNTDPLSLLLADAIVEPDHGPAHRALESYLDEHPEARLEAEAAMATWSALDGLDDEPVPSEDLRRRFDLMVDGWQAHRRPSLWSQLVATLERWWPRQPGWQMATAGAMLVLGLVVGSTVLAPRAPATDLVRLEGEVAQLTRLVSLSLLDQSSASDRLAGVSYSRERDAARDEAVLAALLDTVENDPNVNVRLAAIDTLAAHLDYRPVMDGLRQALEQPDQVPLVQAAVGDVLLTSGDGTAAEAVERLLDRDDLEPIVRDLLTRRLARLSS